MLAPAASGTNPPTANDEAFMSRGPPRRPMARLPLVVVLLAAGAFSGCIDDAQSTDDLRAIFGDAAIQDDNATALIVTPVLEGQVGEGAWGPGAAWTVEAPKIALAKTDPGPQGGGGTSHPLQLPTRTGSLRVRFIKAAELGDYEARWAVVRSVTTEFNWTAPRPATQPFMVNVEGPGPVFVAAELLRGGAVAATVTTPFRGTPSVHWMIESSVRPVKPQGLAPQAQPPDPPNYGEMADEFPFEVPVTGSRFEAVTKFRGSYTPGQGTDVDLEVRPPGGAEAQCMGTGGAMDPVPNNPEQSSEQAILDALPSGSWMVRVGAMSPECGPSFYNNSGSVPYTLDLWLSF